MKKTRGRKSRETIPLIKYLDEFEFIFKTILDYESGDQMGSFDAKKLPSKISCLGTFKELKSFCPKFRSE
jgi:hypothetical protein